MTVSAALSTGELLNVPRLSPGHQQRLARLQRRLARARKGSKRGNPDLIASDRAVRYLLLQIRSKAAQRITRLIRLDLTTGKAVDLPAGKFGLPAVLYW